MFVQSGWLASEVRQGVVLRFSQDLGRAVALGEVGGDLLRGIELRDLVISEEGGFSRGVAFSADRIHLTVDLLGLVLHPRAVLESIVQVDVTTPRLVIERDASGRWNVHDLFTHSRSPLPPEFGGRIVITDGILAYTDAWGATGSPFGTRFTHVTGAIDFQRGQRVSIQAKGRSADGEEAAVRGRYLADPGAYDLDVTAENGAAQHWGGYLVRLSDLRWQGGRFDGQVHVLATPSRSGVVLDYTARLRLTDAQAEYVPTRMQLQHVSGWLALDGDHASTEGLTLEANGSPLSLVGEIAYPGGPWLNLAITSPALDLANVRALFYPRARLGLTGVARGDVWITGPADAPSLDGDVTSASGRLNRQTFSDLRTRVSYAGGMLTLTDLSARLAGGRVAGDAVLNVTGGAPEYQFAGSTENVDVHALRSVGLQVPSGLAGRMSGDVAGAVRDGGAHVLAGVSMDAGSVGGQAFDVLHALFWDDAGAVHLDSLRARAGAATVDASGRIGPHGALDLNLSARNVSLTRVAGGTLFGTVPLTGYVTLDGRLTGTTAEPVISGDVTAWDGRLGPVPFAFAAGDLTVSPAGLSSHGLDLLDGPTRYRIHGGVRLHPLSAENLVVNADEVRLGPGVHDAIPSSDITGILSGHATLNGPLTRPVVVGEVSLVRGSVRGQHLDRAEARIAGEGTRFHLLTFDARVNGSHLRAAGTIDTRGPVDVHMWGEAIRLADLDAVFSSADAAQGTVSLTGDVRGTLQDPDVRARLLSPDLVLRRQAFSASGVAEYRGGVLSLGPLEFAQGPARYRLSGEVRGGPSPAADLTLDVRQGQIATIVGASGLSLPLPLTGTIDGTVTLSGPLRDPSARLSVTLRDGLVSGVALGAGTADLTLTHGAIDIRKFELTSGQGRLTARGRVTLNGTSEVEVSAQDLDPTILRPLFHIDRPVEGRLNFTMQWSGPTRNPTAGLSLEAINAGIPGVVADRIVGLIYYKDGVIHIEDGMIEKGPHKVVIQGTLPVAPGRLALAPRGPLDLALHLEDADLSLLTLLTPRIQDASGTIVGEVTVGGTVASPRMSGYVRSRGGRMRYAALSTPIENVGADIAFSQERILVNDLSATIGGGPLSIHGTVGVSDFRPEALSLRLRAQHLTLNVPGLYDGGVDADLALTGPAGGPVLSGEVSLSHGQVTSATGVDHDGWRGAPVALDVSVVAGDDVWYDQGSVRAAVAGQVHVGGTPDQPTLSGRVRSLAGTISLLGTSFTLTEGEAAFSEALGLYPQITAHAQAMVARPQATLGETRVFLDANCVLPDPTPTCLVLSADPPMTRSEILALLAGTTAYSPTATPDVVGQGVVGRVLLGSIGQAFQRALRLDEFTISYDSTVQNPVTLRIGKFVIQNLYVSVAEVMGRQQTASGSVVSPPAPPTGTLTPLNPNGQSYGVLGLQLVLSPSVALSYDVDTLGDNGAFLLTRIPF